MKCKECGAKIPENKKFCIDCGAWVNPPEERQCIHNNYYEPERYRYTPSVIKNHEQQKTTPSSYKQPAGTKNRSTSINKGVIVLAGIVIAVFAVFVASMVLFNTVDEFFSDDSYWDSDSYIDSIILNSDVESVDLYDGYADEQEQLALEYIENYIAGMDYATFDKFTALDTEKVYTDIMKKHMEYHSFASEEEFYSDIKDAYEEPVSDIHSHISADIKSFTESKFEYFSAAYNSQDISFYVTYSYKIDSTELYDYYYSYTDELLADEGKNTADYLPDHNTMTDIYDICVDFVINDGFDSYIESVWLVVADAGNGPEIVYDEILIDEMINLLD